MLESQIEHVACNLVFEHLGIESLKLNVRANTGWPDRLFWIPGGKPLLIEFKRPGEKPEPKQRHIHEKLRRLGYQVEVHDNALRAFSSVIAALGATRLSKASRQVLARARRICTFLGPWSREK